MWPGGGVGSDCMVFKGHWPKRGGKVTSPPLGYNCMFLKNLILFDAQTKQCSRPCRPSQYVELSPHMYPYAPILQVCCPPPIKHWCTYIYICVCVCIYRSAQPNRCRNVMRRNSQSKRTKKKIIKATIDINIYTMMSIIMGIFGGGQNQRNRRGPKRRVKAKRAAIQSQGLNGSRSGGLVHEGGALAAGGFGTLFAPNRPVPRPQANPNEALSQWVAFFCENTDEEKNPI